MYFDRAFLGPTVGGVLVDHFGFPWACIGVVAVFAVCVSNILNYLIIPHKHTARNFLKILYSLLKTVYIQISWLLKPADEEPHCFHIHNKFSHLGPS